MKAGWTEKPISQCFKVKSGDFLPAKAMATDGNIHVYGGNGITGKHNAKNLTGENIIIGRVGAYCGNVRYVSGDVWVTDNAFYISEYFTTFDYGYLATLLEYKQLRNTANQAAQPVVSYTTIKDVLLQYPPFPEQQRIVTILDEAFDGIAIAKANAEKNLQNARALFESHLQSVFTQRGEGWVDTTIGQQIRFIDYRGKTPEKTESGLRLITAKNVKMGYLQEQPMEFVAPESYDSWMTRGIPRSGDVLFTTEAPLANVTQLDTDEKVVFAQRIIIMQTDAAKLDSTFLKYLLLSQPVQQRIHAKGTGATVQGIKASLLKTIEISFPKSVDDQVQIVAKLDNLRTETQRLESIYQQKLAALDALKKSLLDQAFTGAL